MTHSQAINAAIRQARRSGNDWFVIYEDREEGYNIALDEELDTWFQGCTIHYCVDRFGNVHCEGAYA